MGRHVVFYETAEGRQPAEEFLDSLNSTEAQKVTWTLKLIEDLDRVPINYFKKLPDTDDIWECRIRFASKIFRMLAFMDGSDVVLTHGFIKKTQKTPKREIEKAEENRKDYFDRKRRKQS